MNEDIKKKMAYLLGMKLKQVRTRLNKSLEETAVFLDITVRNLKEYESGSLEIKIGASSLVELFRIWGATYKDVFFYQILNKETAQEIFNFYQNPRNIDYVDYFLIHNIDDDKSLDEVKDLFKKKFS